MRIAFLTLVLSSGLGPSTASAEDAPEPEGYFVLAPEAAASLAAFEEDTTGSFAYSIRRDYSDSTSARLLAIAESTYPPRDAVLERCLEVGAELGPDTAGVLLWWHRGAGTARLPYAVTGAAVEHYLNLTRLSRESASLGVGTQALHWSRLAYRASIEPRESLDHGGRAFRNVYVATLELTWAYDDGTFQPYVRARRVVVLAADGRVLAVTGDGEAVEKVSISPRRTIGREKRLHR